MVVEREGNTKVAQLFECDLFRLCPYCGGKEKLGRTRFLIFEAEIIPSYGIMEDECGKCRGEKIPAVDVAIVG
jgi:hypothetical protein